MEDAPAIGLYQPVLEYVSRDHVTTVADGSRLATAADRYASVQYWSVNTETVYKTP